jgi:hypothetical protein
MTLSNLPSSPLNGCSQLGTEISRSGLPGVTSIVFTDILVKRNEVPGDRENPGVGLLARLGGGFPTGALCPSICPPCPPQVILVARAIQFNPIALLARRRLSRPRDDLFSPGSAISLPTAITLQSMLQMGFGP